MGYEETVVELVKRIEALAQHKPNLLYVKRGVDLIPELKCDDLHPTNEQLDRALYVVRTYTVWKEGNDGVLY